MSIQDRVAFPADGTNVVDTGDGVSRHILLVSALCFVIVFAWSSQIINATQIVAAALALCVGLNARAVMKLDEVDEQGLGDKPASLETVLGATVLSALAAVSLILASSIFAPLAGYAQTVLFVVTSVGVFAAAVTLEAIVSILTCFVLKPLVSKSAIGAEIAVMLNLQQKYQMQLA